MGHKRKSTIYTLNFSEVPGYEDLEVRARSMELGPFLELMAIFDEGGLTKENCDRLFGGFAGRLVDWNFEDDDDQPIPATVEGLYSLELEDARVVIEAWRDAVSGVTAPLEPGSTGGEKSLVASIPMETLQPSSHAS